MFLYLKSCFHLALLSITNPLISQRSAPDSHMKVKWTAGHQTGRRLDCIISMKIKVHVFRRCLQDDVQSVALVCTYQNTEKMLCENERAGERERLQTRLSSPHSRLITAGSGCHWITEMIRYCVPQSWCWWSVKGRCFPRLLTSDGAHWQLRGSAFNDFETSLGSDTVWFTDFRTPLQSVTMKFIKFDMRTFLFDSFSW